LNGYRARAGEQPLVRRLQELRHGVAVAENLLQLGGT
jgi:hypothetical protein